MAAIPKSHELIEPIILELGDRARDIVLATRYSPLNNDLLRTIATFLISDSFFMYAYLSGNYFLARLERRF